MLKLKKSLFLALPLALSLSVSTLTAASSIETTSTSEVSAATKSSPTKSPYVLQFRSLTDYDYSNTTGVTDRTYNTYSLVGGIKASDKEIFYVTPRFVQEMNKSSIDKKGTISNKQVELRFERKRFLEQSAIGFDLGTDVRHAINLPHRERKEITADETQIRVTAFRAMNETTDLELQYRYYTTYRTSGARYNDKHRLYLTPYYHFTQTVKGGLSVYQERLSKTDSKGISSFTNTLNAKPQLEYNNGVFSANANINYPAVTKKSFASTATYELELVYYAF